MTVMDRDKICAQWLLVLAVTALVAFALGMLFAQIEFQIASLVSEIGPALLVTIVFGVGAYGAWLVQVVRRTRGEPGQPRDA